MPPFSHGAPHARVPRRMSVQAGAIGLLGLGMNDVTGRTIPGQFAGEMGERFDPWLIEASQYRDTDYTHGAFPEYGFQRQRGRTTPANYRYEAPRLELAQGVLEDQFSARRSLLRSIESQRPGA